MKDKQTDLIKWMEEYLKTYPENLPMFGRLVPKKSHRDIFVVSREAVESKEIIGSACVAGVEIFITPLSFPTYDNKEISVRLSDREGRSSIIKCRGSIPLPHNRFIDIYVYWGGYHHGSYNNSYMNYEDYGTKLSSIGIEMNVEQKMPIQPIKIG